MIGLVDGNNFYVSCERVFDRRLCGKPVAVLSNNDGCCVAMSPEFKALGIPRGTPYFKLKDREAPKGSYDGLIFRSSNYELYGDMSRRIIEVLRGEAVEVEQYSIDEAFIRPPSGALGDLEAYGRAVRKKVLRWTGIPCGVGFAPTKTLAKIANHIGKKREGGVFVMPDDCDGILEGLPASEVWGVGRRLELKLKMAGIHTARQLRDAPNETVRKAGGVLLTRTAMELRGTPCTEEKAYDGDPDSVSCSRCFGTPVTTLDGLRESIASFAAQAAVKMRRHGMLAAGCNVYVQVATRGMFEGGGGFADNFFGRTVMFGKPTDATNEMLKAISREVESLYAPGLQYRKSGVVFLGLEKAGAMRQGDLFAPAEKLESSALYKAIDRLNLKYGKGCVAAASEGLRTADAPWRMKRDKLSARATTRWDELPVVH